MTEKMVLDASALIALISEEKGKEKVEKYLSTAEISTVNLSEVAAYLIKKDMEPKEVTELLQNLALDVVEFNESQSLFAAQLILKTSSKGLSLGDRACLALAHERTRSVLTADRAWGTLNLGVKIVLIR